MAPGFANTLASSLDVQSKRFGLNYDPPSIVLEYLQVSTGKLFHRNIELRSAIRSDPSIVAEKLRQKNEVLLTEDQVPFEQLVTLVTKLQVTLAERASPGLTLSVAPVTQLPDTAQATPDGIKTSPKTSPEASPDDSPEADVATNSKFNGMDYHTADLNKLTNDQLDEHKAAMDVGFFKNQLKPGDSGYQYDVPFEVDPEEAEDCDWDSSDDDA